VTLPPFTGTPQIPGSRIYGRSTSMPDSIPFSDPLMHTRRSALGSLVVVPLLLATLPNPATAQGGVEPTPTMSEGARAYLTEALDSLQAVSMRRATTDWQAVRDSAFLLAAGAQRPDQTYGAIDWALRRVDRHSGLQARFPWVNPELIDGRYGYFRVPFHPAGAQVSLADTLQQVLRDLEGRGACGWVVDLRLNGGGNVWPMYAGVGPLLGDSVLNIEVVEGRTVSRTVYVEGQAIAVGPSGAREVHASVETPYRMRYADAPVAVLTDGGTASSAEALAIAFRTRSNTRLFGQPTGGYATGNRGVRLPDGANMVVTVDAMRDRMGREYGDPIVPDEVVEMPTGIWPTTTDAVARRAIQWLSAQSGCRSTP
jgi:carboxyl-terminal processing protease